MIKRACLRLGLVCVLVCVALVGTVAAQDFQKNYPSSPGTSISVESVSGNISVVGYNGEAIMVRAYKEGRDRDAVEVEDMSSGNEIKLRARYDNCRSCNASIRFEVRVPRSTRFRLGPFSTASGNVEVQDVTGEVRAHSASGNILVKDVTGSANAQTASGNVDVEIERFDGAPKSMTFSSASGNVSVRMPGSADADVRMSTASGSVDTDFPLDLDRDRYGSGNSARGRLGNGTTRLRLSSASGNVSLMRM